MQTTTATDYRRIGQATRLTDAEDYAVIATYKDGDGDPYVRFTGTYDDCADYAQRNFSWDNVERYHVAERIVG